MPSSAGPLDYTRTPQRFFYKGMSLMPQDALGDGKVAYIVNMRSHEEGTLEPRYGQSLITDAALGAGLPIHSIFRLNDVSSFASGGSDEVRFLGSGTVLYADDAAGTTYPVLDTGYSGDPLSAVSAAPVATARPYLYVADSARMRKFNANLDVFPIGIPQPTTPPTGFLTEPQVTYLNPITLNNWSGYADAVYVGSPGGAVPTVPRINTTVANVVYDDPSAGAPGMVSASVADMDNIVPGTIIGVEYSAGNFDTTIVQETLPPISATTIAAILYDSGVAGACSIQPTGSFSAGQVEVPLPDQIRRRYNDLGEPVPPPVTLTRTVDYPVNALVLLGGVEVVRIESIAIGPDGVMSFRCTTSGTFAAGATISGIATLRAWSTNTWTPGNAVTAYALEFTMTAGMANDTIIAGIQAPSPGGFTDFSRVGTRATQPEDIIRLGIKVSALGYVKSVRLTLDVSPVGPTFLRDYYFYEWRAADLVTAIQATSEVVTGYVKDAQREGVSQGQFDTIYRNQYGQDPDTRVTLPNTTGSTIATSQDTQGRQRVPPQSKLASMTPVSTGGAISRQLALGNDAWLTLECRVGDLTRVGTDTSLNLTAVGNAAVWLQTTGTTDPITVDISDVYLTGGFGPDVGLTLPPYVYRYSYRSTVTGERSNTSPPMRAGVLPHRCRVELTALQSAAPQCDVVDWWRFGGTLARWTYVGTAPNDSTPVYDDDMADRLIDGGERPRTDLYQPWPTSDIPRTGTCNVAGTSIEWVSGDTFNTLWAPDTLIIINGIATQLYQSPASSTRLEVVDNVGAGSAVPFSIPTPTLLSTSLPTIWGGSIGGAWFNFACGDPNDPGALHWTNGNDPDAAADSHYLVVSSASEPLQNGYVEADGSIYVASTERIYAILPNPGGVSDFVARATACDRGFWSRWAYAVSPLGGCYFLAKDGIYFTVNGSAPKSLTMPDFQPLFPQEGQPAPEAIRNLYPVDMTDVASLKLTIVGQCLYFDYKDTQGNYRTLVYEILYDRWTPDTYPVGITARLGEPGPQILDHMMGGADGNLRQYDSTKITDVEEDIPWAVWTSWANGQDARTYKQWGDAILDFNPGGSIAGILVTPVVDNGNVALDQNTLGAGGTVRDTYIVDVGVGADSGYGVWSRNFGLWIEGAVQLCDTQRPLLYLWEPAFVNKGSAVTTRSTDWEDLGYKGAKFVQGIIIRANTFGSPKVLDIQYDGPNAAPQTALSITLDHDGEQTKAYPLAAAGWEPFIAELVRLKGSDSADWVLLDWRWIWEPAPELATQYETQFTTFDYPGFLEVFDGIVAYMSTATVDWTVEYQDGSIATYTLPSSAGAYLRTRQICVAAKGKAVKFTWTSTEPFRLFKRDCTVRVQPWGGTQGYQFQQPFGGPSRIDGAEI